MGQNQNASAVPAPAPTPSSSAPGAAAKTAPTGEPSGTQDYTAATTVGSIGELQRVAPKLWHAMLQGLALTICQNMQDNQMRQKQLRQSYEH